MIGLIGGLFSLIGGGLSSFFGFKTQQGQVVQQVLSTIGSVQNSDADYANATARSIEALYSSGPPIERLWRPCLMWIILGLLVARWFFGYVPAHMSPVEVTAAFEWLNIGLVGYMPCRTFEKITNSIQLGKLLQTYIEKKMA